MLGRGIAGFALVVSVALAAVPLAGQVQADAGTVHRETKSSGTGHVISVDLLRHPITEKARQMLQKALRMIDSGRHEAAIGQLRETLAKYPDSAAYTDSLLGVEYIKTDRYADAVDSLKTAVSLLPHDAVNRYNLGLSLVCTGDYEGGEQEVRRALEIDPKNPTMQALLNALVEYKNSGK